MYLIAIPLILKLCFPDKYKDRWRTLELYHRWTVCLFHITSTLSRNAICSQMISFFTYSNKISIEKGLSTTCWVSKFTTVSEIKLHMVTQYVELTAMKICSKINVMYLPSTISCFICLYANRIMPYHNHYIFNLIVTLQLRSHDYVTYEISYD